MFWILSYPEFYLLATPYLLVSGWLYGKIWQKNYRSTRSLLVAASIFWLLFFLGLALVAGVALVGILVRHAEKV